MLLIGESDVAIHASDSLIGQVSLALLHTTIAAPQLPVSSLASRASMDLICSISFLSAQAQVSLFLILMVLIVAGEAS
jgi:hypothetical protein